MKLNQNTIIPKIIDMKSELGIISKLIDRIIELVYMEDALNFAKETESLINSFPQLKYFSDEAESIKECLIDLYDGYESKESAIDYMNFMKRVVINAQEYIAK